MWYSLANVTTGALASFVISKLTSTFFKMCIFAWSTIAWKFDPLPDAKMATSHLNSSSGALFWLLEERFEGLDVVDSLSNQV